MKSAEKSWPLDEWHRKQVRMSTDLGIDETRLEWWKLETEYTKKWAIGFTLNIGAGNSTIPADISIDPLVKRDVVAVGEHVPFRSSIFDSVLIYSVLDHVLNDDEVIQEARRLLSDHGRLLVMAGIDDRPVDVDPNHVRHYRTHDALRNLIERNNLKIVDYWNGSRFGIRHVWLTGIKD